MRKSLHKFQERMISEMTYEEYSRDRCHEMMCLARELEQLLGRSKTLEVMGKARENYMFELTKKERGQIKNFEDFKAIEKAENASPSISHTITFTYPEETHDRLTLHVTECLWAKVFKEMKATDLGYVLFCQPDFAYAKACHPKIKMKRTKTLMQGDDCCNHTFYWEGRREGRKEELKFNPTNQRARGPKVAGLLKNERRTPDEDDRDKGSSNTLSNKYFWLGGIKQCSFLEEMLHTN